VAKRRPSNRSVFDQLYFDTASDSSLPVELSAFTTYATKGRIKKKKKKKKKSMRKTEEKRKSKD